MTKHSRPPVPAVVWEDRYEIARGRQRQAERMAAYLLTQRLDPTDVYAEELRNARRYAALVEAEAWEDYAKRCATAQADAAAHEERITRYDQESA